MQPPLWSMRVNIFNVSFDPTTRGFLLGDGTIASSATSTIASRRHHYSDDLLHTAHVQVLAKPMCFIVTPISPKLMVSSLVAYLLMASFDIYRYASSIMAAMF